MFNDQICIIAYTPLVHIDSTSGTWMVPLSRSSCPVQPLSPFWPYSSKQDLFPNGYKRTYVRVYLSVYGRVSRPGNRSCRHIYDQSDLIVVMSISSSMIKADSGCLFCPVTEGAKDGKEKILSELCMTWSSLPPDKKTRQICNLSRGEWALLIPMMANSCQMKSKNRGSHVKVNSL